ncbi:tellurite resistance protein TerC [Microvirga flocculans]|uniref:Tellurite resistance protein TerC n=1 Tax=Microvirga flocculans TaxID=217168 RepID=A0A7W6IFF7_9HYPH|nr:TerC family protein [Microvirga flocculans]MBB4039884.1 tellurite resistance protein TerC [Microvirga flocculans]
MMEGDIWLWVAFAVLVVGLLVLDLGVLHREARAIGVGEALWLSLGYIVLALLFAGGVYWFLGRQAGVEFLTGYFIEKSLSIDNIFVFVLIFSNFGVPAAYQHRVLFWGVLGALALRAVLVFAGVQLLHAFAWMTLVFGAFLIITGIRMLFAAEGEPDLQNNTVLKLLRRRLPVTEDYEGTHFLVRRNGALYVTPLFLVLVMVEFTDLVFAVDSIPAILAITQDPFIVYTSNVMAILGLRAHYFALAGIVKRFVYLKYALSLILVLVGVKMTVNHLYGGKIIPTEAALLATAILIIGAIGLSLLRTRGLKPEDEVKMPTGWVPGSRSQADGKRRARPTPERASQSS